MYFRWETMRFSLTMERMVTFLCLSSSVWSSHDHRIDYSATVMHDLLFSCHQPLGLLVSKVGRGVFNVWNSLSAFYARDGETGIGDRVCSLQCAQVLTEKHSKLLSQPAGARSGTLTITVQRSNQPATNSCQNIKPSLSDLIEGP